MLPLDENAAAQKGIKRGADKVVPVTFRRPMFLSTCLIGVQISHDSL